MRKDPFAWKREALPVALILLVGALAFLPFADRLGFYRDDWYMLWSGIVRGADSIIELFSIDRPFMGYTYALTFRLLGSSPMPWQVYAYVLKSLSALGVYGIVRLVWPNQGRAATAAALLFLIYPGFLGQPNAATKTNQLLSLASGLVSIWLSGVALRASSRITRGLLVAAAILLGLVNFLLYEYMIGLEGMRMGVLWLVRQDGQPLPLRPRIRRLLKDAAPYVCAILLFLVWRLGIFHSERGGTDQFSILQSVAADSRGFLVHLGLQSVMDVVETVVLAWAVPLERYAAEEASRALATALLSGLVLAALAGVGLRIEKKWRAQDEEGAGLAEASRTCIFAGVSLYAALFPVLMAGRHVNFTGGFDKYTLHASPAAAILLAALLFGYVRGRARPALLGALIFLGVSSTLLNAYHWERFWENQKAVWWQLWWRAPGLQDGTTLLTSIPEEGFFEDYEMWGPANLIYRPGVPRIEIGAEVLNPSTIAKVRAGTVEVRGMRKLAYERDFMKSLLLVLPLDGSCLKVVDREDLAVSLQFDPRLIPLLRFSYLDQIDLSAEAALPPTDIFGSEPERGWCYYYQKAELAKQAGDWEAVRQLGQEALAHGLKPKDRAEWLPFLEAYVEAEDSEHTAFITDKVRAVPTVAKEICDELARRTLGFGEEIQAGVSEALCIY